MKLFFALWRARNLEFFRDRAALAWTFVFPLLIVVGCAVAFSQPQTTVFTVGLHGDDAVFAERRWLQRDFIKRLSIADLGRGQEQVRHHQLDLLISSDDQRYWYNPASPKGQAITDLLGEPLASAFVEQQLTGAAVRYVDWVMPGILGMNMMFSALFGVGYVIVRYRQNGVLKRLQATPVTPLQFIAAQLGSRLWIVVAVTSSIFLGCAWALDLLVLGSYATLLLIAIMGAVALIALGLVIASRTANEELAGGLLNIATWPMMFLSEVWFSLENAPRWLQAIANLLPLTHIAKAARAVMIENASLLEVAPHLLALLAMTVVFTVIAASLFRWHSGR